jgi:hypothetical protein
MKIFGREPALWVSTIVSALMLVSALGLDWLSPVQATTIGGVVVALSAALFTRPVAPGLFTGLVTAAVGALAAYGLNLDDSTITAVGAFTLVLFGFITRTQVSPKETALTARTAHPIQ